VVLPRYKNQISELERDFKEKVIIPNKVIDGPSLLKNTSVFVGAGGTMTIEAALLGIPSISCHPKNVLHYILWLKKNNLTEIIEFPEKILKKIEEYLDNPDKMICISKKAENITSKFIDPNEIIIQEIEKFE
jgi:predicted glycosyltransferase